MALGSTIGSVVGTVGGTIVGGPAGGAVGGAVGGGLGSLVDSAVSGSKAKAPDEQDRILQGNVIDLKRKLASIHSGSHASTLGGNVRRDLAAIVEGAKGTSTHGAELTQRLNQISKAGSGAITNYLLALEQTVPQRESAISGILGDISQRELELQMYKYLENRGLQRTQSKSGMENIFGAVAEDESQGGTLSKFLKKMLSNDGEASPIGNVSRGVSPTGVGSTMPPSMKKSTPSTGAYGSAAPPSRITDMLDIGVKIDDGTPEGLATSERLSQIGAAGAK